MIRKATMKDVPMILTMFGEMRDYHDKIESKQEKLLPWKKTRHEGFKKHLLRTLESKDAIVLIAEDKMVLGYGIGVLKLNKQRQQTVGLITDVYVRASERGKGYGQELLDALHSFFKEKQVTVMELFVHHHNKAAQEFYAKNSFFPVQVKMQAKV